MTLNCLTTMNKTIVNINKNAQSYWYEGTEKKYTATITAYKECGNKFTICFTVHTDNGLVGIKCKNNKKYSTLSEEERKKLYTIGNTYPIPEKTLNTILQKQKTPIIRMPLNIAWAQ